MCYKLEKKKPATKDWPAEHQVRPTTGSPPLPHARMVWLNELAEKLKTTPQDLLLSADQSYWEWRGLLPRWCHGIRFLGRMEKESRYDQIYGAGPWTVGRLLTQQIPRSVGLRLAIHVLSTKPVLVPAAWAKAIRPRVRRIASKVA